jgi:hypothetical protein
MPHIATKTTLNCCLLAITASLIGCAAYAHKIPLAEADVQIIDRANGQHLPVYWHDGRRYVAGTPGHRYAIEISNRGVGRMLAVVSVDGVNAVTGATAAWDQNGYVFEPGQRWQIAGWRKSQSEVAAFEFTRLDNSYAARTGRPANVGAIGVAFFRERPQPVATPPISMSNEARREAPTAARSDGAAEAAPAADSLAAPARAREKIGTGHGRIEDSQVALTDFERARETPDQVITIYYDSHDNLMVQGILPPPLPPTAADPFPGSARSLRFVADPPG